MVLFALSLILFLLAFAAGAWLMFTSLRPQPGIETFCVKCGNNLTGITTEYCTKCRRLLGPEMTVTCSRSAIGGGRLALGLLVVIVTAILAAWTLAA